MKNFAMKLLGFTTAYVFVFATLNQTNVNIRILLMMHSIGFILIPLMSYTVLTDNYTTNKTFKDWYEDHPMDTLEDEEDN
ncbi:hypothetical protein [Flavobacterium nitratireducens]|uniref:hypothetical protein n=1 Tax=Flavobacterium nitratireducens TaxID=992289 RepID=UPI0024158D7D|nr:hypothetical protein [Flavobacterium nitratireducens]